MLVVHWSSTDQTSLGHLRLCAALRPACSPLARLQTSAQGVHCLAQMIPEVHHWGKGEALEKWWLAIWIHPSDAAALSVCHHREVSTGHFNPPVRLLVRFKEFCLHNSLNVAHLCSRAVNSCWPKFTHSHFNCRAIVPVWAVTDAFE